MSAKYNTLNTEYNSKKAYLDILIKKYDASKNAYEKDINYWNSQGGAPKNEYDALEERRRVLNDQVTAINQAQNSLNILVKTINAEQVIPIHTEKPEMFKKFTDKIIFANITVISGL